VPVYEWGLNLTYVGNEGRLNLKRRDKEVQYDAHVSFAEFSCLTADRKRMSLAYETGSGKLSGNGRYS
jgi:hypothetical protein